LRRVRNPEEHARQVRESLTFRELVERWLAQHHAKTRTVETLRVCLVRPLERFGDRPAASLKPEELQLWLVGLRWKRRGHEQRPIADSYRHSVLRAISGTYSWGMAVGLVDVNPTRAVKQRQPQRGENIIPFESWAEVERVAEEAGRWGPLIVFAVDCGGRPGELLTLEHRHVDGDRVYLPGTKTDGSRRVVHLTRRGVEAYTAFPRAISTPLVWHQEGEPLRWNTFTKRVWSTAVELAGLEKRAPYCMRHTFAYFSLRAGVPIADLAREMGHTSVARTFITYGMWADELGQRAANLRDAWATGEDSRVEVDG
jgi:integrase